MLRTLGLSVTDAEGTVKVTALLQTPFCWTLTMPLTALAATVAETCVSLHEFAEALVPPIQAIPLSCEEPKPVP